jgi:hypothetical protein
MNIEDVEKNDICGGGGGGSSGSGCGMSDMQKRQDVFNMAKKIKEEYYSNNNKNILFKNSQKHHCAKKITENHSLEELINCTIFNIENTNKLFVDYNMFKLFVYPQIFDFVISFFFNVLDKIVSKYGNYELHIDLNAFTVSAANRYKTIFDFFYNEIINTNSKFYSFMDKMCIYNTPSSIDNFYLIFKNFLNSPLKLKMILFLKEESDALIKNLISTEIVFEF